ncbi:hypothetical protein EAN55_24065 [Escherichia albertii]|nr:hypothetical protein [Escherichia albertii]
MSKCQKSSAPTINNDNLRFGTSFSPSRRILKPFNWRIVNCVFRMFFNRINFGWKPFNTRTIESFPACRGTFLHTTCRGFY